MTAMNYSGTVGVAGCGRMGLPMARAMARAGIDVIGFDIRPAADFGDFAPRMVSDPAEFAARCDVALSVVRDQRQTDDLLFDAQGLLVGPRRPRTLAICSTLSPRYLATVAERSPEGLALIDAPMSGAAVAAEEGRLSFMLGGCDPDLDRLAPLFDAMGRVSHRMGAFGAGMTAKVLNNFVAAASVSAVRQALAWADTLGVDRGRLMALMNDSSGQTWFGSNFDRIEFARDGYAQDNSIGVLHKDVEAAIDAVGADPEAGLQAALLAALRNLGPDRS